MKLTHLIALILAMLIVSPSAASAGVYHAYYGSSANLLDSHWKTSTLGGPYQLNNTSIAAAPGNYTSNSFAQYQFQVRALQLYIACVTGSYKTDNASSRFEADFNDSQLLFDGRGEGAYSACGGAPAGTTHFDLGYLISPAAAVSGNGNFASWSQIDLTLIDPDAPQILGLGGASGWLGGGCHDVHWSMRDWGSGVRATRLVRDSDGAVIYDWAAPNASTAQPGPGDINFAPCVTAPGSGTYSYHLEGSDFSGNAAASANFQESFDIDPPTAAANFANYSSYNTYRPALTWTVADAHSGISSVDVRLDGAPINETLIGNTVTLAPAANLPLGEHQLILAVVDNAGNRTSLSRGIVINDTTPPAISIGAPGSAGDNTPTLNASATDDYSGLDASTWSVAVNGQPVDINAAGGHISADLGFLVNGTHAITVQVADGAGNIATSTFHYTARSADGASPLPGLTGIFVLDAPVSIDKGATFRIRAAAAKNGRPLAGLRAEIHQGATTVAGKPISADGTVDISLALNAGEPLTLVVNGSGLAEAPIDFTFHAPAAVTGGGAAAAVAGASSTPAKPAARPIIVARVVDGDTIQLRDGRTVRLLQVDAPEASGPAECFGGRATIALRHMLRPGARIRLSADRHLSHVDSRGYLLRYVFAGKRNINQALVQQGAASPYFAAGHRGRFAAALLADARVARASQRGLWGACPHTKLAPKLGAQTGPA